jgi:hypothetical protein
VSEPAVSRAGKSLYHAVALGMSVYSRIAFRVGLATGPETWPLRRHEILLATHRAETDVPVLCSVFYREGLVRKRGRPKLRFAARDDMFERGFFAGFPPELPLRARRMLYPIAAGRLLPGVRVSPVPYPGAHVMRLGSALGALPGDTPLRDLVAEDVRARLEARADEAGLPKPVKARDVLRGEFADLLWRGYERDDLAAPAFEEAWRRRSELATEQLRQVVDVIARGEPMLFFPEGRPSPDGEIGPLRGGLRLLLRRGRPDAVRAVALAYDHLTCGRPYVELSSGAPFPPPTERVDEVVLGALKAVTPLTCGQVLAHELLSVARAGGGRLSPTGLEQALTGAVEAAYGVGRPVAGSLRQPETLRERLEDALRRLARDGLMSAETPRLLGLHKDAILADAGLVRLEREYNTAAGAPADVT